jgi:glyoxylase-like metal-dependent hydrolase (beta-lactamase superfamily II)
MCALSREVISAARPRAGLVALLRAVVALVALAGCATSHSVTELSGGITVHTFRRAYANVFVVARGDAFFMVDAGFEKEAAALEGDLRREGFDPAKLRAIVVTHGHHDHAGGASHFQERFHTPIIAGAGDASLLTAGAALDPLCPTNAMARSRLQDDQASRFTGITADRLVESSLELEALTGVPGTITVLPGHTMGSLVVSVPGAAFVGDLFRGAIAGSSAEVHFYMCDLEDNRRDVRELLGRIAPAATTFFPGHFGPVRREAVEERFAGP